VLGLGGIGATAKAVATVAAVAAIGVGAADRTGLVQVTGAGGEGAAETVPATTGRPPAAPAAARAALPAPAIGSTERPAASPPPGVDPAPRGPIDRAGPAGKGPGEAGGAPIPEIATEASNGKAGGKAGAGQARAPGKGKGKKTGNGRAAKTDPPPGQVRKASKEKKPGKGAGAVTGGKGAAKHAIPLKPDQGQGAPPPKPVPTPKAHGAAGPTEPPKSTGPPETKAADPTAAAPEIPDRGRPEGDPETSP
jgi:hypothetical protein